MGGAGSDPEVRRGSVEAHAQFLRPINIAGLSHGFPDGTDKSLRCANAHCGIVLQILVLHEAVKSELDVAAEKKRACLIYHAKIANGSFTAPFFDSIFVPRIFWDIPISFDSTLRRGRSRCQRDV